MQPRASVRQDEARQADVERQNTAGDHAANLVEAKIKRREGLETVEAGGDFDPIVG